nr:unnamed protein product [Callosobruchus analis]
MEQLQETIKSMAEENKKLKREQEHLKNRVGEMEKEVAAMKKKLSVSEMEGRKNNVMSGTNGDKDAETNVKKFTDNSYGIYPSKKVKSDKNGKSIVSHNGTKYEAIVISTNDNKDDLHQTMEDEEAQKTDQAPFRFEDFSFGPDLIDLNSSNSLLQSSFGNPSYLENDIQKKDSENHPEYSLTAEIRDTLDYSDDYDDDPEYEPEEDSSEEDIDMQCQISPRITETSAIGSTSFIENRFSTEGACDYTDMFVTRSRGSKCDKKTNVCFYCHKKQQKISRHILTVHKKEEEVEKILALPRGCDERRQLIGNIRKKGNFVFNTNAGINDGELIVSRHQVQSDSFRFQTLC